MIEWGGGDNSLSLHFTDDRLWHIIYRSGITGHLIVENIQDKRRGLFVLRELNRAIEGMGVPTARAIRMSAKNALDLHKRVLKKVEILVEREENG